MKIVDRISSKSSFIFALAGAAIGLGNIWRFPYIAAENGGGIFFLTYIVFILLLGIPVMACEIIIGKIGRSSPTECIQLIAQQTNKSSHWSKLAWLGLTTSTIVLSFYAVISGIIIYYLIQSICGLHVSNFNDSHIIFNRIQQSPTSLMAFNTLFIALTFIISARKISEGIGKLNYLMMPVMYCLLIALVIYASKLDGFKQALIYLLDFKTKDLSANMIIEAMGHSLFTLAAGACCLIAYGAYMPTKQSILKSIAIVVVMDVLVAILVGVITFSIIFSENIPPTAGPGLMFLSLPVALSKISMGNIIQTIFFFLLLSASWTSSVNLAEPLILNIQKYFKLSRAKSATASAIIVLVLSVIPCLALSLWGDVKPIFNKSIFNLYTDIAADILLPITGLLILMFTAKAISVKKLASELTVAPNYANLFMLIIKYISPILVILLIISGIVF